MLENKCVRACAFARECVHVRVRVGVRKCQVREAKRVFEYI